MQEEIKIYMNDLNKKIETIFEDDKFSIISIEITDKYLFFVNKEDNLDDNTSYNTVYRMNLDGVLCKHKKLK